MKRLGVRAYWITRRHWHALREGLAVRTDRDSVEDRCAELINIWVKGGLYQEQHLTRTLPWILRTYPAGASAAAVLDLAIRLASAGQDIFAGGDFEEMLAAIAETHRREPEFLETLGAAEPYFMASSGHRGYWNRNQGTLRNAIRDISPAVLRAGLELATAVTKGHEDGRVVLESLLPALKRLHSSDDGVIGDILMLGNVLTIPGSRRGSGVWQALGRAASLPKERFALVSNAAIFLSRAGNDPQHFVTWASASSNRLDDRQFELVSEAGIRLTERHLAPQHVLDPLLPNANGATLRPQDLQAMLECVEHLVQALQSRNYSYAVNSLGRACTSIEGHRLQTTIDLTAKLAEEGGDPTPVLTLVPALAGLDDPKYEAAMDLARQMVRCSLLPDPAFAPSLSSAATSLDWPGYLSVIDTALRLAAAKIEPTPLLQRGAPIAARMEDIGSALSIIEHYLLRTGAWNAGWLPARAEGLQAASGAPSTMELEAGLRVFERLVEKIQAAGGSAGTAPGLADLSRRALATLGEYDDFNIVLHAAVTHEEEQTDSYYGTSSSYTVEDEPARLELVAAGQRRGPLSIELREPAEIEARLRQRSWLWRQNHEWRGRTLERIALLRGQLDSIVDRMRRCGILATTESVAAIYLIGSYAWVDEPHDVDLFFVLRSYCDVKRLTGAQLAATGFEAPAEIGALDLELVGQKTLLDSFKGCDVRHQAALSHRYVLLYGSVLLAGQDIHRDVRISRQALEALRNHLVENSQKAEWPELAGDQGKIAAKRAWRLREADALEEFIGDRGDEVPG